MAMTKAEAAKLTQDMLLRGVIETIITESQILQLLPFMEVTGTALTYNREATLPAATFYDVGDTWTEATPTFTAGDGGAEDHGRRRRCRQLPAGDLRRPERPRGGGDRQPGEGGGATSSRTPSTTATPRSMPRAFDGLTKAAPGRADARRWARTAAR